MQLVAGEASGLARGRPGARAPPPCRRAGVQLLELAVDLALELAGAQLLELAWWADPPATCSPGARVDKGLELGLVAW